MSNHERYWLQNKVLEIAGLEKDPLGPAYGIPITHQKAEEARNKLRKAGYVLWQNPAGEWDVYPNGTPSSKFDTSGIRVGCFINTDK
ncbi:hypothetical protein [Shimazuella alba]|uniref:Uncharacterized protein n=1 Tax=Shimazuella alba TaxID=2690964 RepID=A0A6I4VSX1_9BACL|nr:hypothetical protein [Shimazuella alba]MXQ53558.1 hypothetical protein [Shimazuella alba]